MSLFAGKTNPAGLLLLLWFFLWFTPVPVLYAGNDELRLDDLIAEALKKNPEILAARSRAQAAVYRVDQSKALSDPMFMLGYQNEGFKKLTIGESDSSMGMFSVSQMFPFPGKRRLKEELATKDAQSISAMYEAARFNLISRIKEIYYDLSLGHKNLDILKERTVLFSRIEDAANARYSSGMGTQQEVVMAQTEKYMLLEKEEMQKQKIRVLEGMLNAAAGRPVNTPLGQPGPLRYTPFTNTFEDTLAKIESHSPEIMAKTRMIEGAETKVKMAKKEYYPDITLSAGYFPRTKGIMDMWNLTASINIPLYGGTKQKHAVLEANAQATEAKHNLEATRFMFASGLRELLSMVEASERLMKLYKEGLIPKANQDVQLAISGYISGKTEALTVITRIKALLDYDILYWQQFVEREKAIARLDAMMGNDINRPLTEETAVGFPSSQRWGERAHDIR